MISTVLFDLDDTLVDQAGAARAALVPWAAEIGVCGTADQITHRWAAISDPHYQRYQRREVTFEQQRRARVREFAPHLMRTDDTAADAAFASYLRRHEAAWVCFDDAVPTLRRLRSAGLRVGILTNGGERHQNLKLDLVGLRDEVEVMISSSTLPFGKPDPRAFTTALHRLQVAPHETLMVGNSIEKDVLGALAVGMDAILLDRAGTHSGASVRRIRSLDELTA